MGPSLVDLRRFMANLDPLKPVPGTDERQYVRLDDVRGNRSFSSTKTLAHIVRITTESCQVFSGFPGSGKSTELLRLKESLDPTVESGPGGQADLPTHVVFINGEDFFDVYAPVGIADILRVLAWHLDREATLAEGKDPDKEPGYLQRFVDFIKSTEVEFLTKMDFGKFGPLSLMVEFKHNKTFREHVEEALSHRFQVFVEQARQSMQASVERLQKARGAYAQRVVVIVDGLDKITPRKEEERELIENSVESLFLNHAQLLHIPCHVIYTFPLWLRYRRPDLGTHFHQEPVVIPMVKVFDQEHRAFAAGVDRLMDLIGRRIDAEAIFGSAAPQALRELILASGGYLRDLVRLVRNLIVVSERFPVDIEFVHEVIDNLAQDYKRTLYGTELDVLAEVGRYHKVPLESRERQAKFARLLETRLILAYRNGEEWYDLHPMVRDDPRVKERMSAM